MNNLVSLWNDALDLTTAQASSADALCSWRSLLPVGEHLRISRDWKFRNLAYSRLSKELAIDILPPSTEHLIADIQNSFKQYESNVLPYSWQDRVQSYLLDCCSWQTNLKPSRKEVIGEFIAGRMYAFMELQQVTLLFDERIPAAVFEFECPVEEYLGDYGFGFVRTKSGTRLASHQACWDLRTANGDEID